MNEPFDYVLLVVLIGLIGLCLFVKGSKNGWDVAGMIFLGMILTAAIAPVLMVFKFLVELIFM